MAKLVYTAITSLDGYVADEDGNFDWSAPDAEVHAFVNDLERPIGTYLYGRRLYDTMAVWETVPSGADQLPVVRDYAEIWRAADKVVYSTTLSNVSSARTRIEQKFEPDAVRQISAGHRRPFGFRPIATYRWAEPISPLKRSRPAWSTSATCSSRP